MSTRADRILPMRTALLVLLMFLTQAAKPNQWRMSLPVKYTFVLADGKVIVLEEMTKEAKARIDSVGLHSAELTFKNCEVLIFDYDGGLLKRMRMRGTRMECLVPDSIVRSIGEFEFSRTVLTWPAVGNTPQMRTIIVWNSTAKRTSRTLHVIRSGASASRADVHA